MSGFIICLIVKVILKIQIILRQRQAEPQIPSQSLMVGLAFLAMVAGALSLFGIFF